MIHLEARNINTGRVVCTFEDPKLAFEFCRERKDLGPLAVWAVEIIRRERLLEAPPAIPFKGAVARAGRGP